jgi:putative ABC transport system permease protein
MSSYKTIESLKGKLKSAKGSVVFSKSLITTQFLCATGVFIFSITIKHQVSYFLEKDLGYDKSSVLTISSVPRIWNPEGVKKMLSVKEEFKTVSQVQSASLSWEIPNGNYGNNISLYTDGKTTDQALSMPIFMTDEDFATTYKIGIDEGTFLQADSKANEIVISQEAQKALGVNVGDRLYIAGSDSIFTLIGVVNDFHFFSLHQK